MLSIDMCHDLLFIPTPALAGATDEQLPVSTVVMDTVFVVTHAVFGALVRSESRVQAFTADVD